MFSIPPQRLRQNVFSVYFMTQLFLNHSHVRDENSNLYIHYMNLDLANNSKKPQSLIQNYMPLKTIVLQKVNNIQENYN